MNMDMVEADLVMEGKLHATKTPKTDEATSTEEEEPVSTSTEEETGGEKTKTGSKVKLKGNVTIVIVAVLGYFAVRLQWSSSWL